MRASLLGGIALAIVGCGSVGHWGSSDGSPTVGPVPNEPSGGFTTAGAPSFGNTTVASSSPPAISGGTMAVAGNVAIIADPDRDLVYLVDLRTPNAPTTLQFLPGDEPGRVVVDGSGRAHIALRGGGALATIDIATAKLVTRRAVCPAPRGLAFDKAADLIHVACATGELVSFPTGTGDATRTLHLDLDLRDVVVQGSDLLVSRFRSAEVLHVGPEGTVKLRQSPPDLVTPYMVPRVAWRMIPRPSGDGALVVHQRASRAIDNHSAATTSSSSGGGGGGYTSAPGGCDAFAVSRDPVATSVTDIGAKTRSIAIPGLVLPVDIAVSPSGERIAVVAAGNGHSQMASSLFTVDSSKIPPGADGCAGESSVSNQLFAQLTSVAFVDEQTILAFSREPASLYVIHIDGDTSPSTPQYSLSSISREDTGHAIFHSNTGNGIACASCHAEGGDDGLVWTFSTQGRRRTPSLKGTLEGTAPYHWSGELADTPALVQKVYKEGMGGPALDNGQTDALRGWLFAMPRPVTLTTVDASAAERGRTLFEGTAGCSTCHSGARLTNNATVDVGTGGAFQVPSLVGVVHRAPYLHDGCAETLQDRFGKTCGGGSSHGNASALGAADLADLIAYLQTL